MVCKCVLECFDLFTKNQNVPAVRQVTIKKIFQKELAIDVFKTKVAQKSTKEKGVVQIQEIKNETMYCKFMVTQVNFSQEHISDLIITIRIYVIAREQQTQNIPLDQTKQKGIIQIQETKEWNDVLIIYGHSGKLLSRALFRFNDHQ